MPAEIGELSVERYLALTDSASQGKTNDFLQRAIARHGSKDLAIESARAFARLIGQFAQRFGSDRDICLYEAPGRVNLMGTHVDHRGGVVNPVATRERIRTVCAAREDDLICAVSQLRDLGEGQFRLSDRLPPRPLRTLGDWLNWTEGEANAIRGGKEFVNYFACGPIYAACFCYPWGRPFVGADFLLDSDLPPSSGMSSSSAVVILATDFFLRCNQQGSEPLTSERLLDLYGYGEWYIGTRGGTGDHAAIKLCRRGAVQPLITTPNIQALEPAAIPEGYDIVLYQSGDEANKSVEPFKTRFNAPIIAYQAGEMMLTDYLGDKNPAGLERLLGERAGMDEKHHHVYLGDAVNHDLLSQSQIYQFLRTLPQVMSQQDLFAKFADRGGSFLAGIQQANEPAGGYRIRDVNAYGFSECMRSRNAGHLLARGDIVGFANLMNISQLGDRVAETADPDTNQAKFCQDDVLSAMASGGRPLSGLAGDYGVSTPNVDRLVSICLSQPDVLGARMSGAGLGGMLIVLGRQGFDQTLDEQLHRQYYAPLKRTFQKVRIFPSDGAGFY